ncbi:MAG: sulfite exporter TauE/SafE family protein [Actinomycetota bacterium]|nr:sulfite exporter TauE/SafE family protein [Actinomycetota bacterium]
MDLLQLAVLAVLGVFGGVLAGAAGVGGGIVFVPTLVYVAGWDIKEAVAASLVIIIFSALSGTIRNQRGEDPVDWRTTVILSSTVAPATLIGVYVASISPEKVVQVVFATILLLLAYPTARGRPEVDPNAKRLPIPLVLVAGVFIGTLSGLVGVGGGVVMVPLMMLGMGLRTKRAVSTSLAVVMFAGIVGAIGYIVTGFSDLLSLPPLIVGSMIGAWFGVRLRERLPDKAVSRGFAIFMVIVAFRILVDAADIL